MISRFCLGLSLLGCATPAVAQRATRTEFHFATPARTIAAAEAVDPTQVEQQIVDRTNAFRTEQKLSTVRVNESLQRAATSFAQFMADNDKYGHEADEHHPWERANMASYDYCILTENIGWQMTGQPTIERLAQRFTDGWNNSPEHRKNMEDADVVDIGVGVAYDEKNNKFYGVQMFGRPKSMAGHFVVANETRQVVKYEIDGKTYELPARYTMTHERCRTADVTIRVNDAAGEQETTVKPMNDARVIIRQAAGGKISLQSKSAKAR